MSGFISHFGTWLFREDGGCDSGHRGRDWGSRGGVCGGGWIQVGGIVGGCGGFSVVEVANGVGISVGDDGAGNRGMLLWVVKEMFVWVVKKLDRGTLLEGK